MVLSDVEETVYLVDVDQQTQQNVVRVSTISPFSCIPVVADWQRLRVQTVKRNSEMLFVRGDGVVLVNFFVFLSLLTSNDVNQWMIGSRLHHQHGKQSSRYTAARWNQWRGAKEKWKNEKNACEVENLLVYPFSLVPSVSLCPYEDHHRPVLSLDTLRSLYIPCPPPSSHPMVINTIPNPDL